jgi:cytidylate kinase
MKKMFTVAIDGPAGSGKSSTAKKVAKQLNYLFIDTGAMYRAVTLLAIRSGNIDNKPALLNLLSENRIVLKSIKNSDSNLVFLNDEDVTELIRTEEINQSVSKISSFSEVREVLVARQQEMGKAGGVVMEGRDIGSVVFPNADFKFFFTASVEERAKRRLADLKAIGSEISLEEVKKSIIRRDKLDSGREASPMGKTADSIEIDTTSMTLDEQCDYIVGLVRAKEQIED